MARSLTNFTILHENFNRQLKKVADRLDKKAGAELLLELAKELIEDVIPATPLKRGRAKAGWRPASRKLKVPNPQAWSPKGRSEGSIKITKKKIIIVNSVPYIVRLEFGWSKQNTSGILRPAMRRLTSSLRRRANKLPGKIVK